MQELTINNFSAVSDAHLVERYQQLMLEHGGVVTRIGFDTVEAMSLETFKTQVAPTLAPDPDHMVVVRDSASGTYSFIVGDGVIRYKVTTAEECTINDVVENLQRNDVKDIVHNTPFPVIREHVTPRCTTLTGAFPAEKRMYPYRDQQYEIYIPATWFAVCMDVNKVVYENRLCVCDQWCPVFENTKLFCWPLGNVYQEGKVCTGSSEIEARIDNREMTVADILIQHRERVLNMNHNDDLLSRFGSDYNDKVNTLYKKLLSEHKIEPCRGCNPSHATLAILSIPEGWSLMPHKPLAASPEGFTA